MFELEIVLIAKIEQLTKQTTNLEREDCKLRKWKPIPEKWYTFSRGTVHIRWTEVVAYDLGSKKILLYFNRLRNIEVFSTSVISCTFETTP